jgi:hypothetical protein
MGTALMNLIDAVMALREYVEIDASKRENKEFSTVEKAMGTAIGWAEVLLSQITDQTAKAGLGFMP